MDGLVEKKYKNKIVIVTGASSGIGKKIANFFLMNDARVIVCSRRLHLMKINFKKYKNVFFFKLDLTKQHEINKLVNFVKKKFNKVDILINNAGNAYYAPIENISRKTLQKAFDINFFNPLFLTKEILKLMKKNNYGRIINISSGGAINCEKNYLSYSSTKAALNTLTKTLSKEITKKNIKVNSMSPGPCKTRMFPKNKLDPSECLQTLDYLASLKKSGYSGKYFTFMKKIEIFPNLKSKKIQKKVT